MAEKIVDQLDEKYVRPRPRVRYTPVSRDTRIFGILEIPVQTEIGHPFLPAQTLAGMNRDDVWLRRDSQNAKANADDLMRIYRWFSGGTPSNAPIPDTSGEWEQFLQAVCRFESGRYFLLIADRLAEASTSSLGGLGCVPWIAVFDFDPQSEQSGLLNAVRTNVEQRRSLQLVVKGQDQPVYPHGGTTWFFARGLAGRETTIETGPYRAWMKVYGRDLGDRVRAVAARIAPAPVTVVVLWNDLKLRDHLGEALGDVAKSFAEEASSVVVCPDVDRLDDLCEKYGAVPVRLSARAVSLGLTDHFIAAGQVAGRCTLANTR